MSYFIGLPVENVDLLIDFKQKYMNNNVPYASWTYDYNYHFTLKHFGKGNLSNTNIKVWEKIRKLGLKSFDYELSGFGMFSGRVLFTEPCHNGLASIIGINIACEIPSTKAHCTIVKYEYGDNFHNAMEDFKKTLDSKEYFGKQSAERICLYSTNGGGREYSVADEFELV